MQAAHSPHTDKDLLSQLSHDLTLIITSVKAFKKESDVETLLTGIKSTETSCM